MARRQSWLRTDLSTTAALQSVCLGDWVKGGFLYRSQFDRNHKMGIYRKPDLRTFDAHVDRLGAPLEGSMTVILAAAA
jgi:hypothetical protein